MEAPDNLSDLFAWNEEATIDPRLHLALSAPEELAGLIESPAWGIYTVPFLTPEFCQALTWFSDVVGDYKPSPGDHYGRPEIDTKRIDQLHRVMVELFDRYMTVLSEICYDGYEVTEISHSFVLKYSMSTEKSMGAHFDDPTSAVTMVVVLNDEFEGGGMNFPRYEWSTGKVRPGTLIMFPSQVTHKHEGLPITSGNRYILTFWLSGGE